MSILDKKCRLLTACFFLNLIICSSFVLFAPAGQKKYIASVKYHTHNVKTPFKEMAIPSQPQTLKRNRQITMSSSSVSIISTLTQTSLSNLHSVTATLSSTPPMAYFLALMAAGVGVPVSEDALCIFAGTILNSKSRVMQIRIITSLYLGVVLSDAVTFWVGRMLNVGLLAPLRKRMNLDDNGVSLDENDPTDIAREVDKSMTVPMTTTTATTGQVKKLRKRDRIRAKVKNAGNYIGLLTRLSIGMRGPMMLLTGFSHQISFMKFFAGTCIGGVLSLSAQLLLGYSMRQNPDALVGIVGGLAVFVIGTSCVGGLLGLGNIMRKKQRSIS